MIHQLRSVHIIIIINVGDLIKIHDPEVNGVHLKYSLYHYKIYRMLWLQGKLERALINFTRLHTEGQGGVHWDTAQTILLWLHTQARRHRLFITALFIYYYTYGSSGSSPYTCTHDIVWSKSSVRFPLGKKSCMWPWSSITAICTCTCHVREYWIKTKWVCMH